MFIVCIIIGSVVKSNMISIIIQVIFGVGIYGVCLLALKDEFVNSIIKKVIHKK